MGYLPSYIKSIGQKSLKEIPFTEVDGLILSMVALIDVKVSIPDSSTLKKRSFYKVMEKQYKFHKKKQFGLILNKNISNMVFSASECHRLKHLKMYNAEVTISEEEVTQSTFFMCDLDDRTTIIVFGSTDDTIVGWREDFDMMYKSDVPCLQKAVNYVNKYCLEDKEYIFVGHSKGGLEALYAAAFCSEEVFNKLKCAYSFDGPGYSVKTLLKVPVYRKSKMLHYVPSEGVVGRFFYEMVPPTIIHSRIRGLQTHDPLTWAINGTNFKRDDSFSLGSDEINKQIDGIMFDYDNDYKKRFVESLFNVLYAGNSKSLTEAGLRPHRGFKVFLSLNKEDRNLIFKLFNQLFVNKIVRKEIILGFLYAFNIDALKEKNKG